MTKHILINNDNTYYYVLYPWESSKISSTLTSILSLRHDVEMIRRSSLYSKKRIQLLYISSSSTKSLQHIFIIKKLVVLELCHQRGLYQVIQRSAELKCLRLKNGSLKQKILAETYLHFSFAL